MKKLIFFIGLLILIAPAAAQVSVTYEIGQDRILVGDEVECFLIIKNPNPIPENLRSIVFFSDLISPRIFSEVGVIPPNSEYRLPFIFKAEKEGTHIVEVSVKTYNGIIRTYIPFTVESAEPELVLRTSEVYLGEKNIISVSAIWDSAVRIKPLFNASPSESYGNDFEFVFTPEKPEKLRFEIEYNNGDNIHSVVKEVNPVWVTSSGVTLSVTYNRNAYSNEAVEVTVKVANLKKSPINSLTIAIGENEKFIPELKPNETWEGHFYIQPEKSTDVTLKYRDELGKEHEMTKKLEFSTINESAVQICGYEFEDSTLTGEVCNLGSTEVKNVIVRFGGKSYFVGSILPEDYEVFSFKAKGNGTIEVSWKNLAGNVLTISSFAEERKAEIKSTEGGREILYASAIVSVAIILLAILAFRRK
ncbi:hypothetical protein [Geoglobus acetivorans]|uniref:CARDB domain-containing protein n=1 Tax=Geoglobus acetivorans TaxID=565033 RepID=A0ABZ3H6A3_GEOAI|nr:hypothetical protein [Geoglobus acetivorans]